MQDMRRSLLAGLLLASLALAKTFTLEQVLSAPFPSELIAAPGGGKVAWLLNERGARNIWIAAAPDFKGVRLTNYTQDDGQDVGQLQWTPDAKAVVYVRGGDLEFLGRPDPNPTADPNGVDQSIWIAAPGEAPRKIGAGHSPVVSPKGDRLAYLSGGQIWTAPLAGGERCPADPRPRRRHRGRRPLVARREQARFRERPHQSQLHCGVRFRLQVAELSRSQRRSRRQSRLVARRQTGRLHPHDERQRTGGAGRGARRAGDPWAIRLASVSDGTGRQVWKSDAGPGSVFHAVVAEDQLVWTGANRIVFPWEQDGWTHLYSVPTEGGSATLLTPGEFEVEHVSYSEDRSEIVYSSNQNDIDRRHIWRVSSAGGRPPAAVTSGDASGMVARAGDRAASRTFAPTRKRPARAAMQFGSAYRRDLAPETIPADFPADDLVVPQQVIYTATDGMPMHAQLFLPPGSAPATKHPALVFMHGGSRRQMLLGWHYMDYYNNAYAMNQYLASQGYVVLSINYRSGIGYGLEFPRGGQLRRERRQ